MKELLKIIVRVCLVSSFFTFLLVMILQIINTEKHVKNCYMPLFSEILSVFIVCSFSTTLIPIFLNLNKKFKDNFILSFLSFYAIGFIVILFFIFDKTFGCKDEPIYCVAIFAPYYLVLTYFFIKWRGNE